MNMQYFWLRLNFKDNFSLYSDHITNFTPKWQKETFGATFCCQKEPFFSMSFSLPKFFPFNFTLLESPSVYLSLWALDSHKAIKKKNTQTISVFFSYLGMIFFIPWFLKYDFSQRNENQNTKFSKQNWKFRAHFQIFGGRKPITLWNKDFAMGGRFFHAESEYGIHFCV